MFGNNNRVDSRKRVFHLLSIVILLLLFGQISLAFAGVDMSIFGPKRYDRLQGKPTVYTDSFERCNPSDQALLRVWNGDGKATSMSSAVVSVNGMPVFVENDFKNSLPYLEKVITINQLNELRVELKSSGPVTSFLRIEIVGKGCDSIAPVISQPLPADGALLKNALPVISASYADEEKGSGINTASAHLLLDGNDITAKASVTASGISYQPAVKLAEGEHTVTVTVSDRATNSSSLTWRFTVDTIAPVVKITSQREGQYLNTPEITVGGTLNDATAVVKVNNQTARVSGTSFSAAGLALVEGVNTITVTATDSATNTGTDTIKLTLDTKAPNAPLLVAPHSPTNVGSTAISGTAEANSTVKIFAVAPGGSTVALVGTVTADPQGHFSLANVTLTEGSTTFTATATDAATNTSAVSESVAIVLDTVSPVITVTAPVANSFINTPAITVTGTVNEPVASVTVNGVAATVAGQSFTLSAQALVEGPNTLTVIATDLAGNPATIGVPVNLDTVAPLVTISAPVNGFLTNNPQVAVAGSVNEPISGVTVNGGAATVSGQNFTLAAHALTEGANTITASATDRAGNPGTAAVTVTLDTIAPNAPVLVAPHSPTNVGNTAISGAAEANSTVKIFAFVPGGSTAALVGTVTADAEGHFSLASVTLTEGSTSFTATATDAATNTSAVSAPVAVMLDTVPPVITVTFPVADSFLNTPAITVTGTVNEPVASVTVNGVAAIVAGQTFTLSVQALVEGTNTLTVTATDLAGNPATIGVPVNLDTVAPQVTIASPVNGFLTNNPQVAVAGSVNEPITGVTVNGGAATVSGQNFTIAAHALAEGANTITATATDRAGNPGTAAVNITLDTIAPNAPVLATIQSPTNVARTTVSGIAEANATVQISAVAPGATTSALVGTVTTDPHGHFSLANVTLTEGSTSFTATATDAATNTSAVSAAVTVVLDTVAPVITVTAPADQTFTNQPTVLVTGSIDDASATLVLNGSTVTVTDLHFEQSLPLTGAATTITLTATDPAGNASTATVHVNLDTTPPVVTISAPVNGLLTNIGQVSIFGSVNEPVTVVTVNGSAATLTGQAFTFPGFALTDSLNTLSVEAVDRAGNRGTATVQVTLDAQAPQLSLTAPAQAAAGATVTLSATGSDNRGITLTELRADGLPVWSASPDSETSLSRAISYTLSPELPPTTVVTFQLRGYDAAGNAGTGQAQLTVSQGPTGPGYIQGEAYDDGKGLRLAGTVVTVAGDAGVTVTLTTPADGGYFYEATPGSYLVRLAKNGYTPVERQLLVHAEKNSVSIDARLTPVSSESHLVDAAGATVKAQLSPNGADGSAAAIELQLPANALTAQVDLRLTPVSNQGLAGVLPKGWSPVAVVDLAPEPRLDTNGQTVSLSFAQPAFLKVPLTSIITLTPAATVTLAAYDFTSHAWLALNPGTVSSDGKFISAALPGSGQYALLLADAAPAPPTAIVGQPLFAATAADPDASAFSATGRVVPAVAPPSVGLQALGELTLAVGADQTLTSGLVLSGRVTERFDLFTGEVLQPAEYIQDLVLYQAPCVTNKGQGIAGVASSAVNLRTTFPVTPSHDYTITQLMMGKVGIEVNPRPQEMAGTMVGTDGARIMGSDGTILAIPANALTKTVPVELKTVPAAIAAVAVANDFTLLGAVDINLTNQTLAASAEVSLPAPAGFNPGLPVVVAKSFEVNGALKLKLVAIARPAGALITSAVNVAGVTLPGIIATGNYYFLQAKAPLGFVKGVVSDAAGAPFTGAFVTTTSCSLSDLAAGNGAYLAAATVGTFTANGVDLHKNDLGTTNGAIAVPLTVTTANIQILATPPVVVSITPANAATGVQPNVPVVVVFTEPVDRSTISDTTISVVEAGGAKVNGVFSFNPAGDTVTFYPAAPLKSETAHTVTVASSIKDLQGYNLLQSVSAIFTVRDTTPPPMPAAGSITATFPDADGFITVTATQGSAVYTSTVLIINDTSGMIVSVVPQSNGSFTGRIQAQLGDEIKIVLMDATGNQTLISYITYKSDDGRYLVTAKGGKVEGEGGLVLDIPDGALVGSTIIKITPVVETGLLHPVPDKGRFIAAVNIDTGGINFQKEVHLSVTAPNLPTGAVPFVAKPIVYHNPETDADENLYQIIDSTKIVDGRLTTASPPFDGIYTFGIFAFMYVDPVSVIGGPVIISGITYQDKDGIPGYLPGPAPTNDQPVRGAVVRCPAADSFVVFSDSNGHYASYGFSVNDVCRNFAVTAIHPQTMFRHTANIMTCDAPYIVNNLNFKLADKDTQIPDTAAPVINMNLKVVPGQPVTSFVAGTIPVNTNIEVPIDIIEHQMASATLTVYYKTPDMTSPIRYTPALIPPRDPVAYPVTGQPTADLYQYVYQTEFSAPIAQVMPNYFRPNAPGSYTLEVEATDASGHVSKKSVTFRVVLAGETPTGVEGPPTIDEIIPADDTEEIMVTMPIFVTFSEPIGASGINGSTFRLIDNETHNDVPVDRYPSIEGGQMRITLQPKSNLFYGRSYTVVVSNKGVTDPNLRIKDAVTNLSTGTFLDMKDDDGRRVTFTTKIPQAYDLSATDQFKGGWDIALYTNPTDGKTYVYETAKENGWHVMDVTDPSQPHIVFNYPSPSPYWSYRGIAVDPQTGYLAMTDNIAFPSGGQYGYVRFYSLIENPAQPVQVGQEKLAEAYSGIPGRVALSGNFAYIATVNAGLQVVDIDAAKQRYANHLMTDGSSIVGTFDTMNYGQPWDIVVYKGGKGVLTTSAGYLLTLDLATPQMPQLMNAFRPDGYAASRVAVVPEYAYTDETGATQVIDLAITTGKGRLNTINITNPYNPEKLIPGTAVNELGAEVSIDALDIVVSREAGLVFVTDLGSIQVFDIKDPRNPKLLNAITGLPDPTGAVDSNGNPVMIPIGTTPALVEKGGWVYLANQSQGMRVLDLDPAYIIVDPPSIPVSKAEPHLAKEDVRIDYEILADLSYTAKSARVYIYKSGTEIWSTAISPTIGKGTVIYPAKTSGIVFDINSAYEVNIILDPDLKIKKESGKKKMPLSWECLITDYNHDRIINTVDYDKARSENNKFYFWINDDLDKGDTDGTDVPGDKSWLQRLFLTSLNGKDDVINGTRDLVDFFPVYIDIQDVLTKFDASKFRYVLKNEDAAVNFAFTNLTPDHVEDYLTNPLSNLSSSKTFQITKEGIVINTLSDGPNFLASIKNGSQRIILVEGREKTEKPLSLEVYDERGAKVFVSNLNISLDGVEQMFRHKNLIKDGGGPVPEHGTIGGEPDRTKPPTNYPDKVCTGNDTGDGKNFVFVHGYNVDGQQARGWQAEMFKRMFWSGSDAKFWGVSWYGSDTQLLDLVTVNYHINVQNAFRTAPAFKDFLNTLSGPTSIAAHSLGNMLVSACLNDSNTSTDPKEKVTASISNVIMIDAAVSLEAYKADNQGQNALFDNTNPMVHPDWYGYQKRLGASEWYTLFDDNADHRRGMTWRNRFANLPAGINYYNFYSSGEEVLDTHQGNPDLFDIITHGKGRYAWALQEKLKGRMLTGWVLGSRYGGWGFNVANSDYFVCSKDQLSESQQETCAMILPPKANMLSSELLKTVPFFNKSSMPQLFEQGITGSDYAKNNQTKLLAEAFPALTLPAGGPGGGDMARMFNIDNVINMQDRFANGWPEERGGKTKMKWFHSDLREVSYAYIYSIFDNFKLIVR